MGIDKLSEECTDVIGPADLYERDKVPSLFLPLALVFLKYVPVNKGAAVLDAACGTGIVARLVSERVGSEGFVVGVDIDQDMIEVAKANTPPHAPINWYVGNVDNMPFLENNKFDWVVCQQGFQYFNDKPGALREMYRVLKSNGGLAMVIARSVDRENQPYQWAKVEALRKHVSAEAGEKQRNLVPFFDGSEDDLRSQMVRAGFSAINIHNVVVKRNREVPEKFVTEKDYSDLDQETQSAVVSDIRKAMEPFRTNNGTVVPYGFHIALGHK